MSARTLHFEPISDPPTDDGEFSILDQDDNEVAVANGIEAARSIVAGDKLLGAAREAIATAEGRS